MTVAILATAAVLWAVVVLVVLCWCMAASDADRAIERHRRQR